MIPGKIIPNLKFGILSNFHGNVFQKIVEIRGIIGLNYLGSEFRTPKFQIRRELTREPEVLGLCLFYTIISVSSNDKIIDNFILMYKHGDKGVQLATKFMQIG